jgi:hypothetical protein
LSAETVQAAGTTTKFPSVELAIETLLPAAGEVRVSGAR